MRLHTMLGAVSVAVGLVNLPVQAGELTFNIMNDSNYIISSFQVNEGDGWSKNWLRGEVRAGQKVGMKFFRDGPCEVQVRVGWRTTDGGQTIGKPWNIDICDANTVYFHGNEVTYD